MLESETLLGERLQDGTVCRSVRDGQPRLWRPTPWMFTVSNVAR